MSKRIDQRRIAKRGRRRSRTATNAVTPGGSTALRALTGGALALPGMVMPAAADTPIEKPEGVYSYARYFEDGAPSGKVAVGDSDRYEIDVHQISLATPLSETRDLRLDLVVETMSGASPWAVVPNTENGDLELLMSESSIEDTRIDALLSANFYNPMGKSSLSGGVSFEDDYRSINLGAGIERHFQSKHTTVSASAGVSVDEVDPVDDHVDFPVGSNFDERDKDYKQGYTVNAGISRIIDRNSIIQLSGTYKHSRGYLDDPYKLVFFLDDLELRADSRPGGRHQFSAMARYRRHAPRFFGTLHLDYRYHADTWDIQSHTAEVAWYQDIFDFAQLIPSFRYYTQQEADFYQPFFQSRPSVDHYSSDYRLSTYGAVAFRAKLVSKPVEIGRLRMEGNVGYEHYIADADYALFSSDFDDNPGLVTYNLISVALTGRF